MSNRKSNHIHSSASLLVVGSPQCGKTGASSERVNKEEEVKNFNLKIKK
jgi:hypothetical protein